MGKNHHHKKKLKSEKAKVHITSKTKFLPKGLNVTNTTFKIRPIIIPEQLKDRTESTIISKQKHTIDELLPKLKHFNETVKTDALNELTDIAKSHRIETHLGAIIQTSCGLAQDRERKVRRATIKLLETLLESYPSAQIAPFFVYISTNLRCAMTNIDQNIQEDSLLLLDAVIEKAAKLVAENFQKLFLDFLTLISKLRSGSTSQRTLTLNLGSKITNVKWRIKVLDTLYGLLNVVNESEKVKENVQVAQIDAKSAVYLPIYGRLTFLEEICTKTKENEDFLKQYLKNLLPLLHESWVEVVPEKGGEKLASNSEISMVVRSVVRILELLYQHVIRLKLEHEVFDSKEAEQFLDRLKTHFVIKTGPKRGAYEFSHIIPQLVKKL